MQSKWDYLRSFCVDEDITDLVLVLEVNLHAVGIPDLVRDDGNVNIVEPQTSFCIFRLWSTNNNQFSCTTCVKAKVKAK